MSPLPQPFSAVLLAGGKSTRMGRDKARLIVGGKLLWEHQWAKLEEVGAGERFISGPTDGAWSTTGIDVVLDCVPDAGPLAGVVAALHRATHSWLLVLAVDLPDLPSNLLRDLSHQAMTSGIGQVPARDEWLQPLAAVYPKSALPLAIECLAGSDRSMGNFVWRARERGFVAAYRISETQRVLFRNLNTRGDLAIGEEPIQAHVSR